MDIYDDAMLSVADAATYLAMPASTLGVWKQTEVIHSLPSQRRGWPNLPFIAVVEAFVLRSLREVGFTHRKIRESADGIRHQSGDPYGLARPCVGHDGVDIFVEIGEDLFRARDHNQIIRDTVQDFTRCIEWNGDDPAAETEAVRWEGDPRSPLRLGPARSRREQGSTGGDPRALAWR